MGLLTNIEKNYKKWLWFFSTIIGSFLPIIFRAFIWLIVKERPGIMMNPFDCRDCLYAGLAINLSNFNLVSYKQFDLRIAVTIISGLFILAFAFVIGLSMAFEVSKVTVEGLNWIVITALFFTLIVSFKSNKYAFEAVD